MFFISPEVGSCFCPVSSPTSSCFFVCSSSFFASFSVDLPNPKRVFTVLISLGRNATTNAPTPIINPAGPNIDPANKSIPVSNAGHQSLINLKILETFFSLAGSLNHPISSITALAANSFKNHSPIFLRKFSTGAIAFIAVSFAPLPIPLPVSKRFSLRFLLFFSPAILSSSCLPLSKSCCANSVCEIEVTESVML